MNRRYVLIAGLLLAGGWLAAAADQPPAAQKRPATILLLRHAEKPPAEEMSVHLTDQGKKRADALPRLFKASPDRPDPFPTPAFVFAAKDSKKSHRSTETVGPLGKALQLPVDTTFENKEYEKLADELLGQPKYAGKVVLVGWHHGTMPAFARKLGAADAPEAWKAEVFDRVWQITYDPAGKAAFRDRPQRLLPGDAGE